MDDDAVSRTESYGVSSALLDHHERQQALRDAQLQRGECYNDLPTATTADGRAGLCTIMRALWQENE